MPSQANQLSLYERLGGIYSIATVVDNFIDRVMTDPRLNANPAVNEAHHKVPPAGYRNGRLGQWRPAEIYRAPNA
jgi:hemoglobin